MHGEETPNILMTVIGAALLLMAAVAITVMTQGKEARLQQLLSTHNVAEFLVGTTKFPSMLLQTALGKCAADPEKSQSQDERHETPLSSSSSSLEGIRIKSIALMLADGRRVVVALGES